MEQLQLSSVPVQDSSVQNEQVCIFFQKYQRFCQIRFFESKTAQVCELVLGAFGVVERNALIAEHRSVPVDRLRIYSPRINAPNGVHDKVGLNSIHLMQLSETQMTSTNHMAGTIYNRPTIHYVDYASLEISDVNESGYRTPKVQQPAQIQTPFGGTKLRSIEPSLAQVDIQRVIGIEISGALNKSHGRCVFNAPVARVWSITQRRTLLHKLHPRAKQIAIIGGKGDHDVPKGCSLGQLQEGNYSKKSAQLKARRTESLPCRAEL